MPEISEAIVNEIVQRKAYLAGQEILTIYFGGGTPSLPDPEDIAKIIRAIYANYKVADDAEITLEANPDDITPHKTTAWKNAGINRLSIGIQSFREPDLEFLSRSHSAHQVTQCIAIARNAGFSNLSIDLIYGVPTLTDEGWAENLEKAFSLEIPHISAYSLTVENKTPLEVMIRKGKAAAVDENLSLSHYHILTQQMQLHDYEHYEISNFATPGNYSRHNTSYWKGLHYLGVGPSAHSYNGMSRQWNVANLKEYIESVTSGSVACESEILSPVTRLNEYIMTSLRTQWGCNLLHVKENFGNDAAEKLLNDALPFIEKEQMIFKNFTLILTSGGRLFADSISATLFTENE